MGGKKKLLTKSYLQKKSGEEDVEKSAVWDSEGKLEIFCFYKTLAQLLKKQFYVIRQI